MHKTYETFSTNYNESDEILKHVFFKTLLLRLFTRNCLNIFWEVKWYIFQQANLLFTILTDTETSAFNQSSFFFKKESFFLKDSLHFVFIFDSIFLKFSFSSPSISNFLFVSSDHCFSKICSISFSDACITFFNVLKISLRVQLYFEEPELDSEVEKKVMLQIHNNSIVILLFIYNDTFSLQLRMY